MQSVGDLFNKFKLQDKGGYITQEFQDFGYRMAVELDDIERTSLYMRLAKRESRGILERALGFVKDAANAKSKSRLFMWKFAQLKKEKKALEEDKDIQKSQESLWGDIDFKNVKKKKGNNE